MRWLLWIGWLLPMVAGAKPDSTYVTYAKTYTLKGDSAQLLQRTKEFVQNNRQLFTYTFSYGKPSGLNGIDTAEHGFYKINGDTVFAHTVWLYVGDRNSKCDVLHGDVRFVVKEHTVETTLCNVKYYQYINTKDGYQLQKQGYYKDLDICKHCTTAGIKLGEIVNNNFNSITRGLYKSFR
ncbi:MAG: hypothetical protein H0X33_11585 [Taibaiella sp.]|nr:hypothetical protein [Taibaiella sp.]